MNDSWFVSMLTEIDCPRHWGYESGLHGDDIVLVGLELGTNSGTDKSYMYILGHREITQSHFNEHSKTEQLKPQCSIVHVASIMLLVQENTIILL